MESLLPYFIDFDTDLRAQKNPEKAVKFWAKLAFEVTSCEEATEVFPDMMKCPVCGGGLDQDFEFKHKDIVLA